MRKIYEQPSVIQTPLMANAAVLQVGSPTPPEFSEEPIGNGGGGE